jgi:hypothetical protein
MRQTQTIGLCLAVIATAAIALWTAPAAADQMPRDVIGDWCGHDQAGEIAKTYSRVDKNEACDDGERVVITSSRYTDQEARCKIVSIKTRFDRTIPSNNRTLGVVVARIKARCDGDSDVGVSNERFDVYFSLGQLNIEWRK